MMITPEILRRIAPGANADIIGHAAPALTREFPRAGITTQLRAAHFLAQVAHESANFRTLTEYASGAAYEGRRDLGNTQPGDGRRFRGRGLIQLTGRANYRKFGALVGRDLERNPEQAALPEASVETALAYWNDRRLSPLADRDDIRTITRRINGGFNGLADRQAKLIRAKAALANQPASVAVREIEARAEKAKRTSTQARTGAATAGATGATAAPVAATQEGSVWLPLVILAAFIGGALALVWWSRNKAREADALTANANEGPGE